MAVYNYVKNAPKKWNYFVVKDSVRGKIVSYLPAPAMCGYFAFASVTIVETENHELIRVVGLCNTSDEFKKGQVVKIAAQNDPGFDVVFPFNYVQNKETKKVESVSEYDSKVLNTCWGTLIKV